MTRLRFSPLNIFTKLRPAFESESKFHLIIFTKTSNFYIQQTRRSFSCHYPHLSLVYKRYEGCEN